jgi:SMODS-associating 4TM effector domain
MADDIEQAVRGRSDPELTPEGLLLWQDQMYELRRQSPQVPNLVYKQARTRNERAMNMAAAELATVALQRSEDRGTHGSQR